MRIALALVVAACGAFGSEPAPAPPERALALAYPRLATQLLVTRVDPAIVPVIARSDVAIIDAEAGANDRRPLDAIRAAPPGRFVLAYLTSDEIPRAPGDDQPLASALLSRITRDEWLVEPGSTLATAIGPDDTTIIVADGTAFHVHPPVSASYPADEPTFLLVDDEHVRLLAIDGDALTVERTQPVAHEAGTRIAAHVVRSAGAWMLNLADNAPGRRTWRDDLSDELALLVVHGPWNGVTVPHCAFDIRTLANGRIDLDRDGKLDDHLLEHWAAGFTLLISELRAKLPPGAPILATSDGGECPPAALDGIVLEGWPVGSPLLDYDTGATRYASWSVRGRQLTIGSAIAPEHDLAAMRFGLTSALMSDGLYAYGNGRRDTAWWYDEYDGGGQGAHWLGHPLGPARVEGILRWRLFEHGLAVVNTSGQPASFLPTAGFARIAGKQDPAHNDGRTGPLTIAPRDGYLLRRLP
jgi:hypothetical protein